jgi:hypothetical protein
MATIKDLQKAYEKHGVETYDDDEEDRFEHITMYVYSLHTIRAITDLYKV